MTRNSTVINVTSGPLTMNEAGSPEAVAGVFLWLIMAERRAGVRVVACDNETGVVDLTSGEKIRRRGDELFGLLRPDMHSDPSVFATPGTICEFFAAIRSRTGPRKLARRFKMPVRFGPPFVNAFVTRLDYSATDLELRIEYHVARWRWLVRTLLFRLWSLTLGAQGRRRGCRGGVEAL